MGLKTLKIASRTIQVPSGNPADEPQSFVVRGLGLPALLALFQRNREIAQTMFARFTKGGALPAEGEMATVFLTLAPGLAMEVIAAGAGELDDEAVAMAATLPAPVQLEALEAIGALTVSVHGGLGKFAAAVQRVSAGLAAASSELKA